MSPMDLLRSVLPYSQIIISVLLIVAVLLQRSEAGLGGTFGGGSNFGSSFHTKRGFEKNLFVATIVLAILFVASAILAFYLKTI